MANGPTHTSLGQRPRDQNVKHPEGLKARLINPEPNRKNPKT